MERLTDKIAIYIAAYERPPYGREIEGTVELLKEIQTQLKHYEDLQEQGRLLELPCAVGDTVWDNDWGIPCAYEVTGFSFGNLNEDYCGEDDITVFDQIFVYYRNSSGSITGTFAVSEIGKTVFLTREEAEKALEGNAE